MIMGPQMKPESYLPYLVHDHQTLVVYATLCMTSKSCEDPKYVGRTLGTILVHDKRHSPCRDGSSGV